MKRPKIQHTYKIAKHNNSYVRERSGDEYHTARWTRLSKSFRQQHPLCAECQRRGIIKAGQVVDHIIPYPICNDFFDESNLQTLCEDCNRAKGNRDKKKIQEWRSNRCD